MSDEDAHIGRDETAAAREERGSGLWRKEAHTRNVVKDLRCSTCCSISTTQHNTTQHNTTQHDITQHDIT